MIEVVNIFDTVIAEYKSVRPRFLSGLKIMKKLTPLQHGLIDYAWAGAMIAAPWVFGFSRNKRATRYAVSSGAAVVGLSLLTRYPLGAVKLIPFPLHGVFDAVSGVQTIASPWLLGYSRHRAAKWTHVMSGLASLVVVSLTDYQATTAADRD
jgi:hypothetical protein